MQASPAQQNNLNLSSNVNKPNLKAQNNHIKPNSDLIKANASKGGYNKEMKPPSQPAPVKVAFRRLSPLFTETDFQNLLKMVHENMPNKIDRSIKLEYLYFSPGRISRKRGKIKSVGYVIVERRKGFTPTKVVEIISEAMASVYKDYITHERVDADSIRPLIELAPYQRIFRPKFRRDASEGTYEKDQEYKTFCTILETPIEKLPSADVQLDQKAQDATTEEKPVSALVTYLKERRMSSVRGKSRRGVGSDSRGRNSRSRGSIGNFPRGSRQGPMPSALNKKNLDMKDKKIIKPNSAESPKSKESEKIEMSSPKKEARFI